jgi:peptidyl-prolyl cis-trans isomerase B (cyclophilin B)
LGERWLNASKRRVNKVDIQKTHLELLMTDNTCRRYPSKRKNMSTTPAAERTNGIAIAALVTSFFVSVLGIILGFVALSQIKKSGENGRGLALAGIIIGFVAVGITVLIIILQLVAVAALTGAAAGAATMG